MIGLIPAALDAIALHFGSLPGIASALRGWPEDRVGFDPSAGPVVSVVRLLDSSAPTAPYALEDGPDPLYKLADVQITAQLDLWTAYRSQHDDAARVVSEGLHNRLPLRHGLYLTSTGYHDRPLTCWSTEGVPVDPDRAADEGMWRTRWTLTVQTDQVQRATVPTLTTATIRPTITAQGQTAPEPDYPIP
jgi:hypothetical protein